MNPNPPVKSKYVPVNPIRETSNAEIDLKFRCQHCGQLMPAVRYGARMSPRKATIIDIIKANPGITARHLGIRLNCHATTIKVHIWQINNILVETDKRIEGRFDHGHRIRGRPTYGYRIIKE